MIVVMIVNLIMIYECGHDLDHGYDHGHARGSDSDYECGDGHD